MKDKDIQQKPLNKLFLIILFFLVLILIAWLSGKNRQASETCRLDGTRIVPITRVALVDSNGEEFLFCSLCCAKNWLDKHKEVLPELNNGKASLTVVDEISGQEIDVSLAYWVQSESYSRRENKCQVHVFSDKQAAARYLRQHQGKELPGYLAGLGLQLSWAADFTLENIHGKGQSLSGYQGKIVFLRFWSLKNPFVATDLQNLQEAHERFQKQGFTVVAVNVEDAREDVVRFMETLAVSFPVLLDPDGTVADLYQVTGFPTGFLLDQSGIVESSTVGELTADVLEPFIFSLR